MFFTLIHRTVFPLFPLEHSPPSSSPHPPRSSSAHSHTLIALSPALLVIYRSRILSAYSRIHAAGVIHNDVSLRHIRLAATASEPERIVIIDFDVSTYQGPPSRSDGRGTRKDTAFEHCRDDREEDQEDDRIGNHPYTLLGERRRSEDEDGYPTHFENAFRREMRDVLKLTG